MNEQLKIRPATSNDLEGVIVLYKHLSPSDDPCSIPLAKENFAKFRKIEGSAILLGEIGGEMVASCVVVIIPNLSRNGKPYALIENVVTHTNHRNKGHGKAILDAATEHAWEHGCYKVMLMTGSKRASTLNFYESAGFQQTKTGFQKRIAGV